MGVEALGLGAYHPRYGLGVGARALEARRETWDIPRKGLPDASAHALIRLLSLDARVVLASWEGGMFQDSVNSVESSNGRIELFGSYCPLTYLGEFSEVRVDRAGAESRAALGGGLLKARSWDWGIMYDAGKLWSVSVGRFEFETRDGDVFRSRRGGRTHGKTIGSSPLHIFRDAGHKLCRMAGQCKIIH